LLFEKDRLVSPFNLGCIVDISGFLFSKSKVYPLLVEDLQTKSGKSLRQVILGD